MWKSLITIILFAFSLPIFSQKLKTVEASYTYHAPENITLEPETEILELYRSVKHYGCDAAHLFPGYDGVVRCLKEDIMFNKFDKK